MTRKPDGPDRRRQPRVRLSKRLQGTVQTVAGATIIDVSVGGALLELGHALKAGSPCLFHLPLEGQRTLKLTGRVVRSTLHALLPRGAGEGLATYRVAIQFVSLTAEERTVLEQRLLSLEGSVAGQPRGATGGEAKPPLGAQAEIVVELEAELPRTPAPKRPEASRPEPTEPEPARPTATRPEPIRPSATRPVASRPLPPIRPWAPKGPPRK